MQAGGEEQKLWLLFSQHRWPGSNLSIAHIDDDVVLCLQVLIMRRVAAPSACSGVACLSPACLRGCERGGVITAQILSKTIIRLA